MVQGHFKKAKSSAPKKTQRKQTGSKIVKAKKTAAQKQQSVAKKLSAALTAGTEQSLASKAGHLELLRGGKKDNKGPNMTSKQSKKAK